MIRKSDKRIISLSYEYTSRFSPQEFDIIETSLEKSPDRLQFCLWDYGKKKIVVDEALRQKTLEKEAKAEQERREARGHIGLDDLAGLTNTQINNWVDSNVTDLAGGRLAIKKLAKWCRALTRALMLRQDD